MNRLPRARPRRYPPPEAWCGACGRVMPRTWRGNCVDCEAEAEVLRRRPRPRRRISEPPVKSVARPVPATADERVIACLPPVMREVHELLYVQGLGVREAARRRGVAPATIVAARDSLLGHLAAVVNAGANTCFVSGKNSKGSLMLKKKIPVYAGNCEIHLDPDAGYHGYAANSQSLVLTGEQSVFLGKLYEALHAGGIELQSQGAVVGWLIDQFREQLRLDSLIQANAFTGEQPCAVCGEVITRAQFEAGQVVSHAGRTVTMGHAFHFHSDGKPTADKAANLKKMDDASAAAEALLTIGAK